MYKKNIVDTFSNHNIQKSHARCISKKECIDVGLVITHLEENQELQDATLATYYAFMHTFSNTHGVKITENYNGVAYIEHAATPSSK